MQLVVLDAQIVNLTPGMTSLEMGAVTIAIARGALKELLEDSLILIRRELGIPVLTPTFLSSESSAAPSRDSQDSATDKQALAPGQNAP